MTCLDFPHCILEGCNQEEDIGLWNVHNDTNRIGYLGTSAVGKVPTAMAEVVEILPSASCFILCDRGQQPFSP